MHFKMTAGKWLPFCLGLNTLKSGDVRTGASNYSSNYSPFLYGVKNLTMSYIVRYISSSLLVRTPCLYLGYFSWQVTLQSGNRNKIEIKYINLPLNCCPNFRMSPAYLLYNYYDVLGSDSYTIYFPLRWVSRKLQKCLEQRFLWWQIIDWTSAWTNQAAYQIHMVCLCLRLKSHVLETGQQPCLSI